MTAPYAGCVNCLHQGPEPGPAGCQHPDAGTLDFWEQDSTAECWTPRPPTLYQWSPTSPGPEWELIREEDCLTYTRRLWRKQAGDPESTPTGPSVDTP